MLGQIIGEQELIFLPKDGPRHNLAGLSLKDLPLPIAIAREHPDRRQEHDDRRNCKNKMQLLLVAPGLFRGRHFPRLPKRPSNSED